MISNSNSSSIHIGIIGDVHQQFNQFDVDTFNQSNYSLLLFVGDLSNYRHQDGVEMARIMAKLTKPTLFIPGNHDAVHGLQLISEIKQWTFLAKLFARGQRRRERHLRNVLGSIEYGGFSTHSFGNFDVIAARPYAMGGSQFSYRHHLQAQFGIDSIEASARKLIQCVDTAHSDSLIFLAHNGPTGLGTRKTDIWGCDFRPEEGDFGDWDLQQAIEHAQSIGKRIIAVFGGHMHHHIKGGGNRQWHLTKDGINYVNTARVPRIFRQNGYSTHHHIHLSFNDTSVQVEEKLVENNL